jgi:hypothetical protein
MVVQRIHFVIGKLPVQKIHVGQRLTACQRYALFYKVYFLQNFSLVKNGKISAAGF